MVKIIMIFAIAFVFILLAVLTGTESKEAKALAENAKRTVATVDRVIYSDTGNVKYYVTFSENGHKVTAQTSHYSSKTKSLNAGDQVEIGYFYIGEKTARAFIIDDRVAPVSDSVPTYCKVFAGIGTLLLLVASAALAKYIVLH